ncbi:MAG: 50S ribosomal protein L11 methyltransferase [Kiritimatiellae bacterium]|nr:50S ribosomal protein L11 methyltransferase [Kiritimatiellia bacterium]
MTVVSCSIDERYVNPLFEVFDGGDFILTSYRDVEETSATMQIFLPDPSDAPRAAEALVAAGRIVGLDLAPVTGTIPDEDWKLSYRKHFKTEEISPRLVVRPPWEAVSPAPGQKVLTLDPGIAFGTGQHPTTRACLDAIDALAAENADRTFLDVGCGSGILSIAAALEGFRDVRGFDNDPDAVRNANENAEANGLGALFSDGDLSVPGTAAPADVVAANVLAPVLVRFAREVGALVNPGGRLILSGILDEQYEEVRASYAAQGFTEVSNRLIGEWRTGLFARPR